MSLQSAKMPSLKDKLAKVEIIPEVKEKKVVEIKKIKNKKDE